MPEMDQRQVLLIAGALAAGYLLWRKLSVPSAAEHPAPAGVDPQLWQYVLDASGETGVPPEIIGGLVATESSWRVPNAPENQAKCGVPCANASCHAGLTQMNKDAVDYVGGDWSGICDPENAIHWGAAYLKREYDRFGNWDAAIQAYNVGGGAYNSGATNPVYLARVNKFAGQYSATSGLGSVPRFRLFAPRFS